MSRDTTKRGIPADYDGSNPDLCNARTKSGRPCRAAKRAHGRCKWHGGLSTGPRTPEGKARALANLVQYRRPKGTASRIRVRAGMTAVSSREVLAGANHCVVHRHNTNDWHG